MKFNFDFFIKIITGLVFFTLLWYNVILLNSPGNTDDKTSLFSTASANFGNISSYKALHEAVPNYIAKQCENSKWSKQYCKKRILQRTSILYNYPLYSRSIEGIYNIIKDHNIDQCKKISISYTFGELLIFLIASFALLYICLMKHQSNLGLIFVFSMLAASPYLFPNISPGILNLIEPYSSKIYAPYDDTFTLYNMLFFLPQFTDIKDSFLATYARGVLGMIFIIQSILFLYQRRISFIVLTLFTPFIHVGQAIFGNFLLLMAIIFESLLYRSRLKQNLVLVVALISVLFYCYVYNSIFYLNSKAISLNLDYEMIVDYFGSIVTILRYMFIILLIYLSVSFYKKGESSIVIQRLLLMSSICILSTESLRILSYIISFDSLKLYYLVRRIEASSNLIYFTLLLYMMFLFLYRKIPVYFKRLKGLSFGVFTNLSMVLFLATSLLFSYEKIESNLETVKYNLGNLDNDLCLYFEGEKKQYIPIEKIDFMSIEPHEEILFNLGIYNFMESRKENR